jgi:Flp pilus assembly pilin Flp
MSGYRPTRKGLNNKIVNKENTVQNRISRKKNNQKGVTVVEYAIMLALIAIAVAVAAPNITSAVVGVFSKASSVMNK